MTRSETEDGVDGEAGLSPRQVRQLRGLADFFRGKRVLVAFSGGVDSSLLAYLAKEHSSDTLLVTESSILYPPEDTEGARLFAQEFGIPHEVIAMDPLDAEEFVANPPDRCYTCKRELYGALMEIRARGGFDLVVDGTNYDDLGDHRPGFRAVKELGVETPLADLELTKDDVRAIARHLHLPVAEKPSMACLSSRIPYNERITREKLARIRDAEHFLREEFHLTQVRVRHHGTGLARIEVLPGELGRLLDRTAFQRVVYLLKTLGFHYVTLDMEGFRSGSLNEDLPRPNSGD
ncbi:MAG: ATP-dependent sacrificial sulfur transferase LarE [Promethearchaeota archaeon]